MRCPAFTTATCIAARPFGQGPGNGNDHGHLGVNGNGHAGFGDSTKQSKTVKKVLKRRKPWMKNGLNQAAVHAYGAVLLIKIGLTTDQAIAATGSSTGYINAMKWIVASGDQDLLDHVLHGQVDVFDAATQVRPIVELKTAFEAAKVVNPAGAIDIFKSAEVKDFIAAAGVVTAEEHFAAAVDAFTIDGTLNRLAAMEQDAA